MPGCCSVGCSNSNAKGFRMFRFPRDPDRRKKWAIKVKRDNWTPKDSSHLCEAHFDPNMFEQNRADGRKLLKWNAIPTIFSHTPPIKERKPPTKRSISILQDTEDQQCDQELTENIDAQSPVSFSSSSFSDEKIQAFHKAYNKLLGRHKIVLKRLQSSKKKIKKLQAEAAIMTGLKRVFNNNQIQAIQKKSSSTHWNNDSVKRALKLKFSCGSSGYEELLRQNFPLPSQRTLRRKIQHINFDAGILHDVFDFLKIKIYNFRDPREKDCALLLDEMSIIPGHTFDNATNSYVGAVTILENSDPKIASHALVFMLAGIVSRWKQTIAYHFTGDSVTGVSIKKIIEEIILKSSNIGLNVISVTSDMGSSNQSFWRQYDITAGRFSKTCNCFTHPVHEGEKVYVIADPIHLFKNIRSSLLNNKIIELSDKTVLKYNLKSKFVQASHLEDLVKFQDKLNFKLVPKLHERDLTPSHFDTMKVGIASHVISHSVSSGLKFLAEELKQEEYETTAWFLDQVEQWFKYMTSRHPVFALSKKNMDTYSKATLFLTEFMELFTTIKIGAKNCFKPCQRGVLISTQSILDIQEYLLEIKKYNFVLTSRFTQDCLENLFSLVRAKQPVPNALQFKANLKLIMLSQYMKDVSKGSYDVDDREDFADFLEVIKVRTPATVREVKINEEKPFKKLQLNTAELNALYCICGYLVSSIKKNNVICEECINSLGGYSPFNLKYERLTVLKNFNNAALFFCNLLTFQYVIKLEEVFNNFIEDVQHQQMDAKTWFYERMRDIPAEHIKECHKLKETLTKRYIIFRLKINSSRKVNKSIFNSKSMHSYVKNLK